MCLVGMLAGMLAGMVVLLIVVPGFEEVDEGLYELGGGFNGFVGAGEEEGEEDDPGEGIAGVDGEVGDGRCCGLGGLNRDLGVHLGWPLASA